jgi:hypothetical protein
MFIKLSYQIILFAPKNLKNSTVCPPATNHSYEYLLVSMYATLPGTTIEPLTGMARPAKG